MILWEGHGPIVHTLAFSPHGERVAIGGRSGMVTVRELHGERLDFPLPEEGSINALTFSPDGENLACAASNGWWLLSLSSGDFHKGNDARSTAAIGYLSPELLAVGVGRRERPEPGGLELWDMSTMRRREPRRDVPSGVRALAVDPVEKRVVWAAGKNVARDLGVTPKLAAWKITEPDFTRFSASREAVAVALNPNGKSFAVASDWKVIVYDIASQGESFTFSGFKATTTSVVYDPSGRFLAVGSWDGSVRLIEPERGREIVSFQWGIGKIIALAIAPDGLVLAAGTDQGVVALWDLE